MTLDPKGLQDHSGSKESTPQLPQPKGQTGLVKEELKGKSLGQQQALLSPDNPENPVRRPSQRRQSLSLTEGSHLVSQSPFLQQDQQQQELQPKPKVVDPKVAFLQSIKPLLNHIPPTGIGKFDATWDPSTGAFDVLVKIHLAFKETTEESQREKFRSDFKTNIEKTWNRGVVFQSIKAGWEEFVARPRIEVQLVDKPDGAHFTMDVNEKKDIRKLEDGTPIGETAQIDAHDTKDPKNTPTHGHYDLTHSGVTVAEAQKANKWVAFGEAERVKNILQMLGLQDIPFPAHKAELSSLMESKLAVFARQAVNEASREKAGIPVALIAEGLCTKREYFDRNLRQRRVDKVAELLHQNDREGKLLIRTGLGDEHESKATLKVDDKFADTWTTKKIVATHEFGHMLGLPDMYNVGNSEHVQKQQNAYSKLLRKSGGNQFAPQDFTKTTASIMSAGTLVFKDYYVTLVDALSKITTQGPDPIKYREWKIV